MCQIIARKERVEEIGLADDLQKPAAEVISVDQVVSAHIVEAYGREINTLHHVLMSKKKELWTVAFFESESGL